jgi:hypothetical protein
MKKGRQSIHGLTKARTESLTGLATKPDAESIGAIAFNEATAYHRRQRLWDIPPNRSARCPLL